MVHKVRLIPGGSQFDVGDTQSILDGALEADVALPFGCQSGSCGACRGRLREGRIHYPRAPQALSQEERAADFVLLCQARADSDVVIEIDEFKPGEPRPMRNLAVRVDAQHRLCHDVAALYLRLPRGRAFDFRAGQYIDILLKPQGRRSFSIASPPSASDRLELHVRRIAGGSFSEHVFDGLPPKTLLRIDGPLGAFFLREGERPIVLVAGGTGFAPAKSMLEDAFERGGTRPIHLYWGVRERRDLYFAARLDQWALTHASFSWTPVLSAGPARHGERTGWVHAAVVADLPDLCGFDVYMSGPPPMVAAGKRAFSEAGLPFERLFYDSFDYAFETWG